MTNYTVHPNVLGFDWWRVMRGEVVVAIVLGKQLAQRLARMLNEDAG